jgi:hypothetical protein
MLEGGFDENADGQPDLTEAFFVLECEAVAASVDTDDVVVLTLTGVRADEAGVEDLVVRTDDWDGVHRTVLEAMGRDPVAEERERRWARFAGRLQCAIAVLDPDQFLVLLGPSGRFVQVMAQHGELRVETVGNQYLPEDQRLPFEDLDLLEELGWDAPTHHLDDDARQREGSPNHWMDLFEDTPTDVVANILIATLREVHGVVEPEDLTYQAAALEGRRILIPTLGLSRAGQL